MKDRHEEVLTAKIRELERQGYRIKRLDGKRKIADALAIKDNQLHAVEVLIAKWNPERQVWEIPRKWRNYKLFDGIIKVVELENPFYPKEKANIAFTR